MVAQACGTYGITVWDEILRFALLALLPLRLTRSSKRRDDLSERGERLVDVRTFLQSLTGGTSRVRSLGTGQIDKIDARDLLGVEVGIHIVPLHGQQEGEHRMRTR